MAAQNRSTLKGLRDIRTHSGRVDAAGVPYMQYMKISALEMERARRNTEKVSAEARITNINARLAEIESEKGALLSGLGERTTTTAPKTIDERSAHTRDTTKRGFRIKY